MSEIQQLLRDHLFEQAPIMIAVLDSGYRIVEANGAFARVFGNWKGRHCYELMKERDSPCERCMAASAFKDGKARVCEGRLKMGGPVSSHFVVRAALLAPAETIANPYLLWLASNVNEASSLQRENELLFERVPCYVGVLDRNLDTGMVVVAQTAGDALGLHPHLHALVPRGGWTRTGAWVPVPFVDPAAAEPLCRHKVLSFLKDEGLLSEERLALLLSWQRHTGFSVDSSVKVEPEDGAGMERLARCMMRPPLSLARMNWTEGAREVAYTLKPKEGQPGAQERLDPLDFLARLLAHVPEPRLHLAHYYGWYSNVSRGRRHKGKDANLATTPSRWHEADGLPPAERRARRRRWAQLVRRVYEVDPLVCPRCGGEMRIISVILDPAVITAILDHLRKRKDTDPRAPPHATGSLEAAS